MENSQQDYSLPHDFTNDKKDEMLSSGGRERDHREEIGLIDSKIKMKISSTNSVDIPMTSREFQSLNLKYEAILNKKRSNNEFVEEVEEEAISDITMMQFIEQSK